jgi:hypothetical protein
MNKFGVSALWPHRAIALLDIIAIAFWIFAFIKLFVVDVDRLIISYFVPQLQWWLDFRALITAGVLTLAALLIRRRWFFLSLIYIISFPLILLLWKIPACLIAIGSWSLSISTLNIFLAAFTSIRYRLAYISVYGVSCCFIALAHSKEFAIAGLVGLAGCAATTVIRSFWKAFQPPGVFRVHQKVFDIAKSIVTTRAAGEKPVSRTELSNLPADLRNQQLNSIKNRILINRSAFFFAAKLNEYRDSQYYLGSTIISVLIMIIFLIFTFSVVYMAIPQIDIDAFRPLPITYFDYLYISFDNALFGSNSSATLIDTLAKAISMFQRFLSIAIIGVFITTIVEVRKSRHTREIDVTIENIRATGNNLELTISEEYSYSSIDEAIQDLATAEDIIYKLILAITRRIPTS